MAGQLEAKASTLPTVVVQISGLVADAAPDGTIIINVGSKGGVKVGDTLAVKRKVRELTDPATGKVLRSIEDPVGSHRHHPSGRRVGHRQIQRRGRAQGRRHGFEFEVAKVRLRLAAGQRSMNLQIGSTIGDYQIVGILGAGGMGKVYKVRNVDFGPRGSNEGAAARSSASAGTGGPLPARDQGAGQPGASATSRRCTPPCAWIINF